MTILRRIHSSGRFSPGAGKSHSGVSRAIGLDYKRPVLTDALPSDITRFTINRQANEFVYHEGAANCSLLLADEIPAVCTPKTQAAASGE
ncbi:MAG: AAA family ATPase [[Clostridium] scindens]